MAASQRDLAAQLERVHTSQGVHSHEMMMMSAQSMMLQQHNAQSTVAITQQLATISAAAGTLKANIVTSVYEAQRSKKGRSTAPAAPTTAAPTPATAVGAAADALTMPVPPAIAELPSVVISGLMPSHIVPGVSPGVAAWTSWHGHLTSLAGNGELHTSQACTAFPSIITTSHTA